MKKKTLLLASLTAVVLLVALGTNVNAVDRWGAGIGFNQYGRSTFGTLSINGGYATSTAALTAAVNGRTDNYAGGAWDAPGLYGMVGRGFNSAGNDVEIVYNGGYSTAAAAASAGNASFPAGSQYAHSVSVITHID